jgi:hypothetical protein
VTVQEYLDVYDQNSWPSEEELAKSIATGEVWEIQWYPDTPVGFYRVCAATFEAALEWAKTVGQT